MFLACRSIAIVGVALLLAACGGGGDGSGSSVAATAPAITTQPQAQSIATGTSATFTVAASGSGTLSFQWSKNGSAISGATSSTYTTPATTLADSGSTYTVTVSNANGQATSTAATLTTLAGAAISGQPQPLTVTTGDTATFTVTATGSSLTYQWNKNGSAITGATGASYTTPAVTLADSGTKFTVTVGNAAGSIASSSATLSANADPEGLYSGTLHYQTLGTTVRLFAIVLKDGTAAAFVTDHVLPVNAPVGYSLHGLAVHPTGASFSSAYSTFLQSGYTFTNGQRISTGTVNGTIVPGSSIMGSFVSDLDSGTFQLTAMTSDYNRPASLATLAGTYAYDSAYFVPPASEMTFHSVTTATADGMNSASTNMGCSSNNAVNSIPNPAHNAYTVTVDFTCPVPPNTVPNLTFTAMSAFFPAGTGANIIGPSAFTTDTTAIITEDLTDQVSYLIISSKQ